VSAPSTLLLRRPDVAAAERRTEAANLRIGVAKTAFFPTISLDATAGLQTAGGVNLLQAGNGFWAVGPALAQTLFDGGRRKAAVRQARDQFDEAAASYRATVLAAFQQVEDNLALCNKLADEAREQAAAVEAARKAESVAMTQYEMGAVTYLDVIVAQTADLEAQRTDLAVATRRLQASVDLIRALGGGWTPQQAVQAVRSGEETFRAP
jgi:NodT family efflux transporter outer membrane factor (OMF) lipoprotein